MSRPRRHIRGGEEVWIHCFLTSAPVVATAWPQAKEPQYAFSRRLGGPQSRSGRFWRRYLKNAGTGNHHNGSNVSWRHHLFKFKGLHKLNMLGVTNQKQALKCTVICVTLYWNVFKFPGFVTSEGLSLTSQKPTIRYISWVQHINSHSTASIPTWRVFQPAVRWPLAVRGGSSAKLFGNVSSSSLGATTSILWMFWPSQHIISNFCDLGCS
jgi:hypothetical protein